MKYEALNPSASPADVELFPLSPRLQDLTDKKICIITINLKDPLIDDFAPRAGQVLQDRYGAKCIFRKKMTPSMSDDERLWRDIRKNADAFLYFASSMPSQTAHAATWAAELEKTGIPGAVVIFDIFHRNAADAIKRSGVTLRVISVPYPLDELDDGALDKIFADIHSSLATQLTQEETRIGLRQFQKPERIATIGTETEIQQYFYESGWTDGLPIIIPTEEKLAGMLAGTGHAADEIITERFPPEGLTATVEKIAVNGIMAGCRPEHLPVLLAAVEAFAVEDNEPKLVSTNSFSFMMVVNGPVRNDIHMNAGINALGPGNLANAAIGRSLQLFIHNLGGGRPGENIMATQGNVSCYSFCFAENEEHSPWEPFHISQGFQTKESTITIFNGGWSHVGNFGFEDYENLAEAIALFEHPEGAVILVSPEKARMFAAQGLTKQDLEQAIWSRATTTMKRFRSSSFYTSFVESNLKGIPWVGEKYLWPKEYLDKSDDDPIQVFPRKFVNVIVVGGKTRDVMQAWRMSRPSTASIDKWR